MGEEPKWDAQASGLALTGDCGQAWDPGSLVHSRFSLSQQKDTQFILGHLLRLLSLVMSDYSKSLTHISFLSQNSHESWPCLPQCVLSGLIALDRPCSFPASGTQASQTAPRSDFQIQVFWTWSLHQDPGLSRLTAAFSRAEGREAVKGSVTVREKLSSDSAEWHCPLSPIH